MYLWGDIHNASPNQMDQLGKLFKAIMVKLPELIVTEDFDNWMALFLANASAFSSTFVGALHGLLEGCDVLSILYSGSKLGTDCIRLLLNKDTMDDFRATLASKEDATSKSVASVIGSDISGME